MTHATQGLPRKDAYLASGWFTPAQESVRVGILQMCKTCDVSVFSPKDDMLYEEGGVFSPKQVFQSNLLQIFNSKFIIANTEGKDMGTVFECGYAHANSIPIVYVYTRPEPFNLMLAQSATIVVKSMKELSHVLTAFRHTGLVPEREYKGAQE